MIEKYLKLFGLNPGSTLSEVKKAYRILAKKNHPDRFMDAEQKKNQETIMIKINEAYQIILNYYKNMNRSKVRNDTFLYKKGVDNFHKARHDGFYGYNYKYCYFSYLDDPSLKIDLETLLERENHLKTSQSQFQQLLKEYPGSDWAFDSEKRLKEIEVILEKINNRISLLKSKTTDKIQESDSKIFSIKEKDTYIYKKGVEYFDKSRLYDYHYGFFSYLNNPYIKIDLNTLREKENNFKTAQSYFNRLLKEYPYSDWTFDSEKRLKEIEYMLDTLGKQILKRMEK